MKQWDYQHRPSQQRLVDAREALIACLLDAGVTVDQDADTAQLVEISTSGAPMEFGRCPESTGAAFGLPGLGG